MDRSTKQKIIKETQTLDDTMDQLDLIEIYRTFHPKTMNVTFFSSSHGTFSKIYHMLLLLSRFSRVWLCDPIDGSPPGSPVPGILQARTLEWVAISFSNA